MSLRGCGQDAKDVVYSVKSIRLFFREKRYIRVLRWILGFSAGFRSLKLLGFGAFGGSNALQTHHQCQLALDLR